MIEPAVFLEELRVFFSTRVSDFVQSEINERRRRVLYYKKFKVLPFYLWIGTPLRIINNEPCFIENNKEIQMEVHRLNHNPLIFILNTKIQNGWESVLRRKIQILEFMAESTPRCNNCGIFTLPHVNVGKTDGVWFVSFRCRECGDYISSQYGIGLKTDLHKIIQHKRT